MFQHCTMHHRHGNNWRWEELVQVLNQSRDSPDQHEVSEANQQECAGNHKTVLDKREEPVSVNVAHSMHPWHLLLVVGTI